jgi:serine/threonine protein kinase
VGVASGVGVVTASLLLVTYTLVPSDVWDHAAAQRSPSPRIAWRLNRRFDLTAAVVLLAGFVFPPIWWISWCCLKRPQDLSLFARRALRASVGLGVLVPLLLTIVFISLAVNSIYLVFGIVLNKYFILALATFVAAAVGVASHACNCCGAATARDTEVFAPVWLPQERRAMIVLMVGFVFFPAWWLAPWLLRKDGRAVTMAWRMNVASMVLAFVWTCSVAVVVGSCLDEQYWWQRYTVGVGASFTYGGLSGCGLLIGVTYLLCVFNMRKHALKVAKVRTTGSADNSSDLHVALLPLRRRDASAVLADIESLLPPLRDDHALSSAMSDRLAQLVTEFDKTRDDNDDDDDDFQLGVEVVSGAGGGAKDSSLLGAVDVGQLPKLILEARAVLATVLAVTNEIVRAAIQRGDLATDGAYAERVKLLTAACRSGDSANCNHHTSESAMECVAPGLLLRRDRFDGDSDAFLGRGASAAVSKGALVELVGGKEVRSTVAVKEIHKTGLAAEREAFRQLLLLNRRLTERHPNIVRLIEVKSNSNVYFVVMQYCDFSLAQQLPAFEDFLHGQGGGGGDGGGGGGGGGDRAGAAGRAEADCSHAGALVLNALVQDLIKAVSFLHSKHIMHCDIKARARAHNQLHARLCWMLSPVACWLAGSRLYRHAHPSLCVWLKTSQRYSMLPRLRLCPSRSEIIVALALYQYASHRTCSRTPSLPLLLHHRPDRFTALHVVSLPAVLSQNLLVSFNRLRKRQACVPSNFHLAQLVVADFGVSRVFSESGAAGSGGGGGGGFSGATATVTMSGLTAQKGVCGTEMCVFAVASGTSVV